MYLTRRDEDSWSAWPKSMRILSPKSGGTRTTRTCWRSDARSCCDCQWWPLSAQTKGYENICKPPEMNTDHDMIVARIRILGNAASRCRIVGARWLTDLQTWREEATKHAEDAKLNSIDRLGQGSEGPGAQIGHRMQ